MIIIPHTSAFWEITKFVFQALARFARSRILGWPFLKFRCTMEFNYKMAINSTPYIVYYINKNELIPLPPSLYVCVVVFSRKCMCTCIIHVLMSPQYSGTDQRFGQKIVCPPKKKLNGPIRLWEILPEKLIKPENLELRNEKVTMIFVFPLFSFI